LDINHAVVKRERKESTPLADQLLPLAKKEARAKPGVRKPPRKRRRMKQYEDYTRLSVSLTVLHLARQRNYPIIRTDLFLINTTIM
jgi:hypothetical protein